MATTSRPTYPAIEKLYQNPTSFDFFQAVRLLEYLHDFSLSQQEHSPAIKKFVQFGVDSKINFPVNSISKLSVVKEDENGLSLSKMLVSFMGLTGINGALPHYYTERLLYYNRHGNFVLRDFFDIFNDRLILLFYQAWKKNHFLVSYELTKNKPKKHDPFTHVLQSLSAAHFNILSSQGTVRKEAFLFYAGAFYGRVRSAAALEQLLNEYFELPIRILQFQARWLSLNISECSIIASGFSQKGQYQEIGKNFVLGQRRKCIQSAFRIYIGPINYTQFESLTPQGELFKAIVHVTKLYVNADLSFGVQLELLAYEAPFCQLIKVNTKRLGWNTWLKSKPLSHNSKSIILYPK